jgi:hypothetical protein
VRGLALMSGAFMLVGFVAWQKVKREVADLTG